MMTIDQWQHDLVKAIWNYDPQQAARLIRIRNTPVEFRYGPARTTPFLEAVANGLAETAETLVRAGADIHAVDGHGRNAVLVAVWRYSATLRREADAPGKVQLLEALIRNGIDCYRRCHSGETALSLARRLAAHDGAGLEEAYLLENRAVAGFLETVFSPEGRDRIKRLKVVPRHPKKACDSYDLAYQLERELAMAL